MTPTITLLACALISVAAVQIAHGSDDDDAGGITPAEALEMPADPDDADDIRDDNDPDDVGQEALQEPVQPFPEPPVADPSAATSE
jgi:hypothetical protein